MAIVKQRNKKTGVTYVYESYSYRDKVTKQPRAKRKLIGRIDDATGEVVPTRKKAKNITTDELSTVDTIASMGGSQSTSILDEIKERDQKIREQNAEIKRLKSEIQHLAAELMRISMRLNSQ